MCYQQVYTRLTNPIPSCEKVPRFSLLIHRAVKLQDVVWHAPLLYGGGGIVTGFVEATKEKSICTRPKSFHDSVPSGQSQALSSTTSPASAIERAVVVPRSMLLVDLLLSRKHGNNCPTEHELKNAKNGTNDDLHTMPCSSLNSPNNSVLSLAAWPSWIVQPSVFSAIWQGTAMWLWSLKSLENLSALHIEAS